MQASLRQTLDRASPTPFPEGRFDGRGIVICAGGVRYFTCAWVLIAILRRVHGVALPIQVWYLGRKEMSDEMRMLLEEEAVEVVDAETVIARYPARIAGGWPLKPYAIAHSRFREVLYLDADTVPLVDPQAAFDWDCYRESGLLFWPDIVDLAKANPVWAKLGLEPKDCVSIDSGLLAVDKSRAWDMLDLTVLLNQHWDELYDVLYGDKDTFLAACLLTGRGQERGFGLIPHRPLVFGYDMVHRDPDGGLFLHHRNNSKWGLIGPNQPAATPALTPSCEEALADLRRRWSGRVFHAPVRSPPALAEEARLAGIRRFHYVSSVAGERRLELLPGGRVGEGRDECEQHWAVIDRDGALVLQLFSGARAAIEFAKEADGSWQGGSTFVPKFSARLVEEEARRTWPFAGRERVPRSAEHLVAALADPALFAAGHDSKTEQELRAALSLLNDRFDDVPEQIRKQLSNATIAERWRVVVADLATALAAVRDRRVAAMERGKIGTHMPDETHYTRAT